MYLNIWGLVYLNIKYFSKRIYLVVNDFEKNYMFSIICLRPKKNDFLVLMIIDNDNISC